MTALLLIGGLVLLVVGGELLVRGASRLAVSLGISPLVVGLTVVAFGTSAPELAVSLQAAAVGAAEMAMGNVVGSNIFNVLFILGLSAMITPLVVDGQIIRQEVPVMIGASLLVLGLSLDGRVSRAEGLALLTGVIVYTTVLVRQSRSQTRALEQEYAEEAHVARAGVAPAAESRLPVQLLLIAAGLVLLVLGSRWLVEGASAIARALGLSELVIGLTIVAGGTSLPEVAASVVAAVRGQRDIAVGNVVGSNIFNLLCVLGAAAAIAPAGMPVPASLLRFDMVVMLAVAVACLPIFFHGRSIVRWEGALLFGYYLAYTAYLVLAASQHDALTTYTLAMRWFFLPLTLITLLVITAREWKRSRAASSP